MRHDQITVAGKGDKNTLTVTVPLAIPRYRLACMLVSAVEGGIGYWCPRQEFQYTEPEAWEPVLDEAEEKPERWPCYDYPLLPGGAVTFLADEDAPVRKCVLNLETIAAGLRVMIDKYPRHFANFMSDCDDAETADVFVQCCVFGDIIYG